MKFGLIFLLCWVYAAHVSTAQSVTFSQLPADGQLYPRTLQSVGIVPIAGRVDGPGATRLSVVVLRNESLFHYRQVPLFYGAGSTANFSTLLTIPAQLAQFRVRVFLHLAADSVLIADRQQIVAGDAYVINGQSNAAAYYSVEYPYQSDYIRTFGRVTGTDPYNPADTLWTKGNTSGYTLVGTWGMELARRLIERYGIPICIINGAAGGAGIQVFNERNAANPMDLNTSHGRLLYRVNKAGLSGAIKAYFFRQGENESSAWAAGWPMNFNTLFQNVSTDYPNLGKFYLFQIHILAGTNPETAVFRDYQRRVSLLQPLIHSLATVGTITYDGVHFGVPGHVQTGQELFPIVARDFYRSTDTLQINSPNIQKVYYTSAARNELVMLFEEDQHMRWPADTTLNDADGNPITHRLPNWLYLDNVSEQVTAGRSDGYRVVLTLREPMTVQQLGYLPPNYPTHPGWLPTPPGYATAFPGPFLTNGRGLRAFAFWNVPIAAPLAPVAGLSVTGSDNTVQLTWTDHPDEQQYVLERRQTTETTFTRLMQLPANTTAYTDLTAQQSGQYWYRLRALTPDAEATADVSIAFTCQVGNLLSSIRAGDWQQPQTWQCGNVPLAISSVQISDNQTVSVIQPVSAAHIRLRGTLSVQAGGSIRFSR